VKLADAPRFPSLCLDYDIEAFHRTWPMTINHEKHRSKRRKLSVLDQHWLGFSSDIAKLPDDNSDRATVGVGVDLKRLAPTSVE